MDMNLAEATNGRFKIWKGFPNVAPTNTGGECDLIARPDTNVMYEPKI